MTKKKKKISASNRDRLFSPFSLDSFFISISQLANNRKRGIVLMVCTRGKILMERFRLSAGDRETFFSIESAGRTIYTLPAHPLILFGVRLSLSLSLISRLVSRSTNWDQSIFANSKYGNEMSQFPGIRGKLGV